MRPVSTSASTAATRVGTREAVVAPQRAEDRAACRLLIEMVEPERVREQPRQAFLEYVQLSERVVSDPEEDVDAEPWPRDELREEIDEAARARLGAVVQKQLLELVEQQAELGAELGGPRRDPVDQAARRVRRLPADRLLD